MNPMMKCRVCGKEYEPCRSAKLQDGVFRWREVACSPDCGAIYLQQINESRGLVPKKAKRSREKKVESVETEIVAESEEKMQILDSNRD